ncbi:hypothetical protein EJ02DRAFT_453393 [Clathrospora elynae]|uniref:Uncharacterized protein n=1 Tax=Clathrospora elynae TaxID=706981 RepID=A0A6A5T2G9_9PLEO|nr:hypothetical protein EJ02DRAFT_453393 [Clathrospora elynae]
MCDSDGARPSSAAIANKLRDVVIAIHKSGRTDDLTVKRVRTRTEKELGLDDGFFKTDSSWKQKSQETILDAVERYCHDEPTPKKASPKPRLAEKKIKATAESARGVKRKAVAPSKKPKKRAKTSSEESEAELSEPPAEISDADSEPPKKTIRRGKKVVTEDSDEEEALKPSAATKDQDSDAEPEAAKNMESTPPPLPDTKGDVSDSDLSSVIDEEPAKKSRQKKAPAAKKEKVPAKPKAPKADDDPDLAEVKRLQGWLVKCGIRKVWSRDPELAKCSTSKEKIRVLKTMLNDVGMDGKYSVEKAAKIKEQREFAKDLEAIQQGEQAWGKATEVTSTGRPSRRAAAKPVVVQKIVLEDDSEEEGGGGSGQDEGRSDDDDDDVKDESGSDDGDKDDDSGDDDSE